MWRDKSSDENKIYSFIEALTLFRKLKQERWESIDEQVQMDINPGVPGEDWIIPPDEGETENILKRDPEYFRLRKALTELVPEIKEIARFLHCNVHHDFDWVNFTSPLIGNDALDDGLIMAHQLLHACERKNYVLQNLANLVQISK